MYWLFSHDPKTQQYAQEAEGKEIFDERREAGFSSPHANAMAEKHFFY